MLFLDFVGFFINVRSYFLLVVQILVNPLFDPPLFEGVLESLLAERSPLELLLVFLLFLVELGLFEFLYGFEFVLSAQVVDAHVG